MLYKFNAASTRRRILRFALAGSVAVAVPIGLASGPAAADPHPGGGHPWQQDCDHTGHFLWQNNRGMPQWGDCDNDNGHWQMQNHGQWMWHRDRDVPPPPVWFRPPPLAGWFGSS